MKWIQVQPLPIQRGFPANGVPVGALSVGAVFATMYGMKARSARREPGADGAAPSHPPLQCTRSNCRAKPPLSDQDKGQGTFKGSSLISLIPRLPPHPY